mgnify:CR=1 FL=1|tara:strand:+ start:324 stop:1268 length:945 start_codon:yes stop_codon:yes gene_type:complete
MAEEKLVPLDTSGNDVEVTLKDEETKEEVEVKESNVREISKEEPTVEVQEEDKKEDEPKKEDELEEYSATVKRRIDKLTRKMRESERREQAAIEYAKKVNEENKKLNTRSTSNDKAYIEDLSTRVTAQIDAAKNNLKNAISNGDVDKQVDYQREIAALTQEEDRVRREKLKLDKDKESKETPISQSPPPQPKPQPDPKAIKWAEDNSWFGEDQIMTYAAYGLHQQLTEQEGFDPKSDEYYEEIDKRIKKEFPHRFKDSKVEENSSNGKPVQAVASAVRSTKSGRKVVRLTPSQVAIAKKLGVPLEEYAKHVKEA